MGAPVTVYFSYAPEDEDLRDALEGHLALLKRERVLTAWYPGKIRAGEETKRERDERLRAAPVVLLLVSASYLRSDDLHDEEMTVALARAKRGEAQVIPVLLRPFDIPAGLFGGLKALPSNGEPVKSWRDLDAAWADVAKGIRHALAEVAEPPSESVNHVEVPPEPQYESESMRALAVQISAARIEDEIRALREKMRAGGRLRAGDALGAGRYTLIEAIGDGGFATVWKAHDRERRELVAVKVLHPDQARDTSRRERFFRGARVMGRLGHEAVVRVLDPGGEDGGYFYFVMELIPGGDLEQAVIHKRVSPERVIPLLLSVSGALAEAHEKGIVHRDVKPANILLNAAGEPRLTDFDLVVVADSRVRTRTRGGMGSFLYMAPEQGRNAKDVDARADVYGLGMTALFCLHGGELPETAVRHPEEVIEGLACSTAIKRVLTRAIEVKRERRFAGAREFGETLRRAAAPTVHIQPPLVQKSPAAPPSGGAHTIALATRRLQSPSPAPPEHALQPAPSSKRGRLALFAVLVAALGGFGAVLWWTSLKERYLDMPDAGATASAQAEPLPLVCPEGMQPIPGGRFMMGTERDAGGDDDESPAHPVRLHPYCMDKTEVTVADYRRCTKTPQNDVTCTTAPTSVSWAGVSEAEVKLWSRFCNGDRADRDKHPINCVDWAQADTYCRWAGKRLPTEAEWEYAARGDDGRPYPWGQDKPRAELLNACGAECRTMAATQLKQSWKVMYEENDHAESTAPVGSYPKGASPFGLMDVSGNVWEWVADWYAPYPQDAGAEVVNPERREKPSGHSRRIVRGGGWYYGVASGVRAAYRIWRDVSARSSDVGFRCARGPK